MHKQSELLNIIVSSWPCPSYTPDLPLLLPSFRMILVNYLQSRYRFYSWISTFHTWCASYESPIVVFQFQFCDSTKNNKVAISALLILTIESSAGSCPEPKTFYLLWIMLIHNFVLYNIIIIIIHIPPLPTFCQAKQVLKSARVAKNTLTKKPKRWLITVSLVKWCIKRVLNANLCEISENK